MWHGIFSKHAAPNALVWVPFRQWRSHRSCKCASDPTSTFTSLSGLMSNMMPVRDFLMCSLKRAFRLQHSDYQNEQSKTLKTDFSNKGWVFLFVRNVNFSCKDVIPFASHSF